MLPEFNQDGNLPVGVHPAIETEVISRFATTSARRQWLGERLRDLLKTAKATGKLERVFLWGSFITSKEAPNDLDVLLVMATGFDLEQVSSDWRVPFDHAQARIRFNASEFMIANDEQLKVAQEAVRNLQRILLAARKVHTAVEYRAMSEPILLELQQREQEILTYLSHSESEAVRV